MNPVSAHSPDPDLLRRFTDGDEEAFTQIVNQYAGLVFCVCNRVLGDRAWAEDVAQETFFRLLGNRRSISQSIGGWLHRAATRLAVDALRSETARRRREAVVAAEAYDLTPDPAAADGPTWSEVSPQLDAALAELPDDERELLVRHFLEGVAQAQIAAERGVSTATLSRRMKDAVASLRLQLARRGVTVVPTVLLVMLARNAADAAVVLPPSLMGGLGKMAMISGNTVPAPFPPAPAPAANGWLASRAVRSKVAMTAACALGLYLAVPYLWLQPPRGPVDGRPAETQNSDAGGPVPARAGTTTTPTTTAPLGTPR